CELDFRNESALLIEHDLRCVGLRASPIHLVKRVFHPLGRARRRIFVLVDIPRRRPEDVKRACNQRGCEQQNRRRQRGHETELGDNSQVVHAGFSCRCRPKRMPATDAKTQRPDVTCGPQYAIMPAMNFADRLAHASRLKESVVVLGIDPQLDAPGAPGIPRGYTLARFCCEIVEACARSAVVVKPQLAFYEARGLEGMRAFCEVVKLARRLGLITIADAKRGDIGTTSAAYAEAFLGDNENDFSCDAVTVNPYQGSDTLMPFIAKVRNGRGVFVLVKTSNPSSGEFQDRNAPNRP